MEIAVEGLTHTSGAFLDFAYDFLQYAIPKYGFYWIEPSNYNRSSRKLFEERFGEIVILFRNRNSLDFNENLTLMSDMESEDIHPFVVCLREKIFRGKLPLMEIIAYFAFLLDMGLICYQMEDPDLLFDIVYDTEAVFHKHIKCYFTVVGGWYSLYRVATQYEMYVTSKSQIDPYSYVEENCAIKY